MHSTVTDHVIREWVQIEHDVDRLNRFYDLYLRALDSRVHPYRLHQLKKYWQKLLWLTELQHELVFLDLDNFHQYFPEIHLDENGNSTDDEKLLTGLTQLHVDTTSHFFCDGNRVFKF